MKYTITMTPDQLVTYSMICDWRFKLKTELLKKRKFRSDWSGKLITDATGCHMHEGIVTRATVPRSINWHYMIFHEVNCFLLLPDEHIPQPPTPAWCLQKAYEYYGHDAVKDWYDSLPFKVKPFILE